MSHCFDGDEDDDEGDVMSGDDNDVDENDDDDDDNDDDDDDDDLKTCIDRANNCFMIHSKHFSLKKMRTSIDVKFRSSFALLSFGMNCLFSCACRQIYKHLNQD